MNKIIRFFTDKYYRRAEMVSYWKKSDSVEAKVVKTPEGHYVMYMQGEKYPFPGHPRGVLLFGPLSPLKHHIKNQIFNDIWAELEKPLTPTGEAQVIERLKKEVLPRIFAITESGKYDMVPFEMLNPPVKELWRAMTAIENGNETVRKLKETLCFILQEDDAYRMRLQWIVKFFPRWYTPTVKHLSFALSMLEQAEMIGDMRERQRLLKRVLLFVLKDPSIRAKFDALFKEIDWSKLALSKADKYFFRAKYFKVDYPEYQY